MPGYVIAEIQIRDRALYRDYQKAAGPSIVQYGGRPLVVSESCELREGDWPHDLTVVIEFPTIEQARLWYESPEYAPARELRFRCAVSRLVLVDGFRLPERAP